MCVIAVVEKSRPSELMVQRMWDQNKHGGGVAWREGGLVHWRKGLLLKEMQTLCATLPTPYIAHFRIASVGGQRAELTHPFAIKDHVNSCDIEGETDGGVLFHNGHWGEWRKVTLETAINFGVPLPEGRWSDSRAMAWLTQLYGPGFLDMIEEKTVVFSLKDIRITPGSGWVKVDDIWCSNDYFVPTVPTPTYTSATGANYGNNNNWYGTTMCKHRSCCRKDGLDTDGYCPAHIKGGQVIDITTGTERTTQAALPAPKTTILGPTGGGRAEHPFDLKEQLLIAEAEWALIDQGILKRSDSNFSKNRLKALRRMVGKKEVSAAKIAQKATTTNH